MKKINLMLRLLLRDRGEFFDRIYSYMDGALESRLEEEHPVYKAVSLEQLLRELEELFGHGEEVLREAALAEAERETRQRWENVRTAGDLEAQWAADATLARYCYLACRLAEPETVVETGVAYGISSAFILRALEVNGHGELHSIDLPPLGGEAERFSGVAVSEDLRHRWHFYRESSRRLLQGLLRRIPPPELFVHDSQHTRRNMQREFEAVWPCLREGGLVLADDVGGNSAFGGLRQREPRLWRVVREEEQGPLFGDAQASLFGVAAKRRQRPA